MALAPRCHALTFGAESEVLLGGAAAAPLAAVGLPACAWAPTRPGLFQGAQRGSRHKGALEDPLGPPDGACEHLTASQDAARKDGGERNEQPLEKLPWGVRQ